MGIGQMLLMRLWKRHIKQGAGKPSGRFWLNKEAYSFYERNGASIETNWWNGRMELKENKCLNTLLILWFWVTCSGGYYLPSTRAARNKGVQKKIKVIRIYGQGWEYTTMKKPRADGNIQACRFLLADKPAGVGGTRYRSRPGQLLCEAAEKRSACSQSPWSAGEWFDIAGQISKGGGTPYQHTGKRRYLKSMWL